MKKKPAAQRAVVAKAKPNDLAPLIAEVRHLIQSARRGVSSVAEFPNSLFGNRAAPIAQHPTGQLVAGEIQQPPAVKFADPVTLSWTHYVLHAREYQWVRAAGERSQ